MLEGTRSTMLCSDDESLFVRTVNQVSEDIHHFQLPNLQSVTSGEKTFLSFLNITSVYRQQINRLCYLTNIPRICG